MNRAAVLILTIILTLCVGMNVYALDSDTIRQMKDLKAIMDEMPETTKKTYNVKEEVKKPVVKEVEKVEEVMEIKAEVEEVEESYEETADQVEESKAMDVEKSYMQSDEDMTDEDKNQGFVFTNENAIIPLDSTETLEEDLGQAIEDVSMNIMADDIVTTETDQAVDLVSEESTDLISESIGEISEDEVTVLDVINNTDSSQSEMIQEEVAATSTDTNVTDFEVNVSDKIDSIDNMEMVEYREDLADEISEEISEINLEIEEIEGAIDQEISDLQHDLDQLSETNLEEEITSDY